MTGQGVAKALVFVLPSRLCQTMILQALDESPSECCGLLAGKRHDGGWVAEDVFPLVNELKSATRFLLRTLSITRTGPVFTVRPVFRHPGVPCA